MTHRQTQLPRKTIVEGDPNQRVSRIRRGRRRCGVDVGGQDDKFIRSLPSQFVVDGLAAGGVGVANVTVERFEIVCQQRRIQFDGNVAGGTEAPVVGQIQFLAQADVQNQWHR
jgi:hypothetical protein